MPKLVQSANSLYMAEVTARMVDTNIDAAKILAGATHMRHKVAKSKILPMYEDAEHAKAGSWLRVLMVGRLITCAQGAYRSIEPLVSTNTADFRKIKLPTYYSDGKHILFSKQILQEPLNLFPGLSTQNLGNSKEAFDAHFIWVHPEGKISDAGFSDISEKDMITHTPEKVHPKTFAVHTPLTRAILTEEYNRSMLYDWRASDLEVVCTKLDKKLPLVGMEVEVSNSNEFTIKVDFQTALVQAINFLNIIIEYESKFREGGCEHYNQLIDNMKFINANDEIASVSKILVDAKENWKSHRKSFAGELTAYREILMNARKTIRE
ncbi:hypothetical protein [Burkholderia plantarii]|uniref:hypothetical protein n=1 Tax=Burkholderia plantarii TaxID=41899 RepID=UPI000AB8C165|nr:hypothetical protein [Burkholderia plantarii]GLZ22483.1 hypothetical protein Bpla01_60120 [Burkholderia plantarii]